MNELKHKYRKFILDDPDSYIELHDIKRRVNEIDTDDSISLIILEICLKELYQNNEDDTSFNDKLINLYNQEFKNKKRKNTSLDKRVLSLYLRELSQNKDLVVDLDNRIYSFCQDKYWDDFSYDYKWKAFSKRSFFDVLEAYIFRKKNGIKTLKLYSDKCDDEINEMLNRSVFEIYKEFFRKLFRTKKIFQFDSGKKVLHLE